MEVAYYKDRQGSVPVKDFLAQFPAKQLAKIDAVIQVAAECQDGMPKGEFSAPVSGYSFLKLRIKVGKVLVRILYVPYQKSKLILLHGYSKPDRYEKSRKRSVDKIIQEALSAADEYYNDFLINPAHHETYELQDEIKRN